MMSSLLRTKFHQPSPPSKRVSRTNLIHAMTENLEAGRLLTLVSAPAGFGKTTLVSEWAMSIHLPVAWLSLEPADDDPGRFFAYLIAALQKVNETIGQEIESILRSGQLPPLSAMTTSLVNDILAASVPFILVLDDFQVIQDRAILKALETILSNPPEQLHLILITREDPPLPLGRLRANNQMLEIRAGDLRFSEREVDLFLNEVMGLSLSKAGIAEMESHTEGWPAGLQLAAIAMHNRADLSGFIAHLSASHRYILGYLTEEVLSRQAEDIQLFLLQTAILNKMCGELCDEVTGRLDSRDVLEKCFRANLFLVPLDDEGRWYRYHHLFQDLLLNQQSRISKQDVRELHRRASRWYEEAGMISDSMDHAVNATDYSHAVKLLEDHARGMVMQGYMKTVEGWMQALPSEWQSHNPRANLAFAWMNLLRGSYERIAPHLTLVEQAISELLPDDESRQSLQAEWLVLKASLLNVVGKPNQAIELAHQALQWTREEDHYVKGLAYAALGGGYLLTGNYADSVDSYQLAIQNCRAGGHHAPEMLAVGGLTVMAVQHGKLHFAYEVGSQAVEHLGQEDVVNSPMVGTVYGCLGFTCYEWNQLDKACSYLQRAIQLSSLSGHNAGVVYAKVLLARVLQAQGDFPAAVRTAQEAAGLLRHGVPAWLKPEVVAHLVRLYLDQEDSTALEEGLQQLGMSFGAQGPVLVDPASFPDPLTHQDGLKSILSLRLILHHVRTGQRIDKLQQGIDQSSQLLDRSLPVQRIEIALQALLLRAQMFNMQGNLEASLADVRQAIELAEPEGYIRTFLDEGPAITALLKLALKQPAKSEGRQVSFIRELLASTVVLGPVDRPGESPTQTAALGSKEKLIEPLTGREMDVIRLMAQGLKYQEIAVRMFITLNTVRFYVKEIYTKLNVNNRTQAIETARKHHLL